MRRIRTEIREAIAHRAWESAWVILVLAIATWALFGCGGSGQGGNRQGTTAVNQPQQQETTK